MAEERIDHIHDCVDQVSCAMKCMIVVEGHIPTFGDPKMCLPQGIFAVNNVFSSGEIRRLEHKIIWWDGIVALLIQVSRPWPLILEFLEKKAVVFVLSMFLWKPMERQAIKPAPSCSSNLWDRAVGRADVARNVDTMRCCVVKFPEENGHSSNPQDHQSGGDRLPAVP